MSLFKTISKCFVLTVLPIVVCCSNLEQNDFIVSNLISKDSNELIYNDIYQTGIDNFRFEFKAVKDADTIQLFEYFLNDATYMAMKYKIARTNDTLTIKTNMPTDYKFNKTQFGTTVILKHEQ